jgi:hypothetical protein
VAGPSVRVPSRTGVSPVETTRETTIYLYGYAARPWMHPGVAACLTTDAIERISKAWCGVRHDKYWRACFQGRPPLNGESPESHGESTRGSRNSIYLCGHGETLMHPGVAACLTTDAVERIFIQTKARCGVRHDKYWRACFRAGLLGMV